MARAGSAVRRTGSYVEAAVREGEPESPWAKLRERVVLGSEAFLDELRGSLSGNSREQPGLKRLQHRPTLAQIIQAVEKVRGDSWADFRDQYGDCIARGRIYSFCIGLASSTQAPLPHCDAAAAILLARFGFNVYS